MEEYDLTDDEHNGYSNSEVTAAATVTPAAASVPTTCDVAARENIAFMPYVETSLLFNIGFYHMLTF